MNKGYICPRVASYPKTDPFKRNFEQGTGDWSNGAEGWNDTTITFRFVYFLLVGYGGSRVRETDTPKVDGSAAG